MLTAPEPHRVAVLSPHPAPLMSHALELAALERSGLGTGEWPGAPWDLTAHGRFRPAYEAVPQ